MASCEWEYICADPALKGGFAENTMFDYAQHDIKIKDGTH